MFQPPWFWCSDLARRCQQSKRYYYFAVFLPSKHNYKPQVACRHVPTGARPVEISPSIKLEFHSQLQSGKQLPVHAQNICLIMKNFKTCPWNFVVLDEARRIVTESAQNSHCWKEQGDWIKGKIFQFACQQLWGTGDNEEETNGINFRPEWKKTKTVHGSSQG